MKTLHWLVVAFLAIGGVASAQTGSLAATYNFFGADTATFTSSSFSLNASNIITGTPTGVFAANVNSLSGLTASTQMLSGLSTTPLAISVPDYLTFTSTGPTGLGSVSGDGNLYTFNLTSVEVSTYSGLTADFVGFGTLSESGPGGFTDAPATINVGFSGANNYSFTFASTPEPSSWTLGLGACAVFFYLRRRQLRS